MTPRPLARMRRAGLFSALTLGLALASLAGCDPRQALYFIQPFEPKIPPPCTALKGKRVVVLARSVPGAQNDFPDLDHELTRQVADEIRAKLKKKVDLVEPQKVFAWADAHRTWTDPADLGEAFDADVVVTLEIAQFQVQDPGSPDLFEGHSAVHVRATELTYPTDSNGKELTHLPRESRVIYDGDRETHFPVQGPMPASAGVSAVTFKNTFLKMVATEVSWHFVDHAPGDNIQDTRMNN